MFGRLGHRGRPDKGAIGARGLLPDGGGLGRVVRWSVLPLRRAGVMSSYGVQVGSARANATCAFGGQLCGYSPEALRKEELS